MNNFKTQRLLQMVTLATIGTASYEYKYQRNQQSMLGFKQRFGSFSRVFPHNQVAEAQADHHSRMNVLFPTQMLEKPKVEEKVADFPIYRRVDVQKHRRIQDKVWVSYQDSVYDITEFIKVHPGGAEKLMMAAGGPIESFWEMYPFHKKDQVKKLLVPYKIGHLHQDDIVKQKDIADFSDMQKDDAIIRSKNLVVHQEFPFCAETNKKFLVDDFLTPPNELYVRNHNLVPEFDEDFEDEFELNLIFKNGEKNLTLSDLRQMKQHSVITQMACAGNRRSHTRKVYKSVKGVNWDVGAIGNNHYTGVLLRDLLFDSGLITQEDIIKGRLTNKHLVATGMDKDFQGEPFSASIPLSRALDPENQVLLAYQMNGKQIPKDHGYPLRLVVPGFIGVRNCKWVCKLEISDEEATSCMQRRDYKWVTETDWSKIDITQYESIMANYQNSCICEPITGETVSDDKVTLKGWAIGDGEKGTQIIKVQISHDEGMTWNDAEIVHKEDNSGKNKNKIFSWTLWKYELDLNQFKDKKQSSVKPKVRSIDSLGTIQDGKWEDMFNARGLLNTTAHEIEIKLTN